MLKIPHAAGSMNRTLFKKIVELHPNLETFVTESHIQAQEGNIARIEPKTKADVRLHMAQIEIRSPREHLARIRKQRHIQAAEDLPAILGIGDEQVVIAEAERPEAAQVFGAAQ